MDSILCHSSHRHRTSEEWMKTQTMIECLFIKYGLTTMLLLGVSDN